MLALKMDHVRRNNRHLNRVRTWPWVITASNQRSIEQNPVSELSKLAEASPIRLQRARWYATNGLIKPE